MINVEQHSSEEDTKPKRIEGMLAKDLKNIVESLKNVYEITVGKHVNKGKNAIQNFMKEQVKTMQLLSIT